MKIQSGVCGAVSYLNRHMVNTGYSICQGIVYKKIKESQFTSIYYGSVKKYLMRAISDLELANVIVPHLSTIENLLSDPDCRIIKPLKINHNLIEVLPAGTCFRISSKRFVKIKTMPEKVSPRAFVRYIFDKDQVPHPLPFVQGKFSNI